MKYYTDYKVFCEDQVTPKSVFVVVDEMVRGKLLIYCPIGQHAEIEAEYLKHCMEISKEYYEFITKGFYTPKEYL